MTAREREAARYLGYGAKAPDGAVAARMARCFSALEGACRPRFVSRPIAVTALNAESDDLARHIEGCARAILLVATLGMEADRLLATWTASDMSLAVVGQACAAALLEEYCDRCMDELTQTLAPGEHLLPRYSPGYGDFSLAHQRRMLDLTDATRRIGVNLTASSMLVPTKSVTAVIGVTDDPTRCHTGKCQSCPNTDCPFRKA